MTRYRVQVEQTIEASVEVDADTPYEAEVLAEDRANKGDYNDIWDDLQVGATYATYGPQEVDQ